MLLDEGHEVGCTWGAACTLSTKQRSASPLFPLLLAPDLRSVTQKCWRNISTCPFPPTPPTCHGTSTSHPSLLPSRPPFSPLTCIGTLRRWRSILTCPFATPSPTALKLSSLQPPLLLLSGPSSAVVLGDAGAACRPSAGGSARRVCRMPFGPGNTHPRQPLVVQHCLACTGAHRRVREDVASCTGSRAVQALKGHAAWRCTLGAELLKQ